MQYENPLRKKKNGVELATRKTRRHSEAHSISIFEETLKGYGIQHGNNERKAEEEEFVYQANIEKKLSEMPQIPYVNTLIYSIVTVAVLLVSSFLAYEASKEVVTAQFKSISHSACRTARLNVQNNFNSQIVLAKQIADALGRGEGLTKANTNSFKRFDIGLERILQENADIFGADYVYFASVNGTLFGYNTVREYVGLMDKTTDNIYTKYYLKRDGSKNRNTSDVKEILKSFNPKIRPWFVGAYENYILYTENKARNSNATNQIEVLPYVSDVFANIDEAGLYSVFISMPVIDSFSNEFIGVISIDFSLGRMGDDLLISKKQLFPNDANDDVIMGIVTKTRSGESVLVAATDASISDALSKHDISDRAIKDVNKYDDLSPKAIKFMKLVSSSIKGEDLNMDVVISREFMTDKELLGLDRWSFFVVTSDEDIKQYASVAAIVTNIYGFLIILVFFAVTWYVRRHIADANRNLIHTEHKISTYFQNIRGQDKAKKDLGSVHDCSTTTAETTDITRTDIVALDKYYFICTPSMYNKFLIYSIVIVFFSNISYWFYSGESVINRQIDTLVFNMGVELQVKLAIYMKAPMGLVKMMAMFYQLGMLPSGLLNEGRDRDRADAGLIGMMLSTPINQRPMQLYIGTQQNSWLDVTSPEADMPLLLYAKDNTTGKDSCTNEPLVKGYYYQTLGHRYHIRSSKNTTLDEYSDYYPTKRPWYIGAAKTPGVPIWTPIYQFKGTNLRAVGITATVGFNHSHKKDELYGVAGVDFTLQQLHVLLKDSLDSMLEPLEGGSGTAYIVEASGNIVAMANGAPVLRVYEEGGQSNRVHASKLCARQDEFPEECEAKVSSTFIEMSDRLENGFFEDRLLPKNYPDGLSIEVGRGSEIGVTLLRLKHISVEKGLDWVLVTGFGRRSFVAKFDRLSDLYLITALGLSLTGISMGFVLVYSNQNRLYGKKNNTTLDKNIEDNELNQRERMKIEVDPDSEEFFQEMRQLIAPTVLSANLVCRLLGNEARPPEIYDTFRKLILDNRIKAAQLFKKLDVNNKGHISRIDFVRSINALGYKPTEAELALLFAALDQNGDGVISYGELVKDEDIVLMEPEATLAEKHRALEYVMLSQNKECHIIDFLYLQRDNDIARVHGYKIFHSKSYGYLVSASVMLNLSLSFLEAPASRQNYYTEYNNRDRIWTLYLMTFISIGAYAIDLCFETWLYGVYELDRSLKEARERKKQNTINKVNEQHHRRYNILIVGRLIILTMFMLDAIIPPYYTGVGTVNPTDEKHTQLVFLLPHTAILRPLWPMLRFGGLRVALHAFLRTIYHARAVFLMFFITLTVFATIGTTLLNNRYPYDTFDSFQSVYKSFSTLFVYMVSAENYPDVVYPPTLCPNASIANTRSGGVISAECNDSFIHLYTFFASLWGTFLIVSLIIASFEEGFTAFMAKNRIDEIMRSRMAIIAAFIVLDKDNGGSLDKLEFLNFFNLTCNTGRFFDVEENFELNGAEFIQLCEELVHEMRPVELSEMHLLEFGDNETLHFDTCSWFDLFKYLKSFDVPFLPPEGADLDQSIPGNSSIVEYWRHRGADFHQEQKRKETHESIGARAIHNVENIFGVTNEVKAVSTNLSRFYEANAYSTTVTCLLFANFGLLCLYGASSQGNVIIIDHLNMIFVVFWFIELMIKISNVGYYRYVHVNDDFFKEVKNKVDGFLVVLSFLSLVSLVIYRLFVLNTGYVFAEWNTCTSPDHCIVNDWARVVLSLNMLRMFGEFAIVKKIVFSFYVIIPNYFTIIQLTVLLIYTYAVYGCISFGGAFKYLHNYDMGQANFNSMTDSIITLLQLYVGEAWNSVMLAAVDGVGSRAYPYFFSYIIISTLLLTNLLVGVIINGFKELVGIQKHAEGKKMTKLPTVLIERALKEGKISEPRLQFKYDNNTVKIIHNPNTLEQLANKVDTEAYEMAKLKRRWRQKREKWKQELEKYNITRGYKFDCLLENSKDEFGFFTEKSRELISRYASIIMEEEEEEAKLKAAQNNDNKRRTSIIKLDLKQLGLED